MTNVVFNKFLKEVINTDIDLLLPNTYKMALLKGYYKDISPDEEHDFYTLQTAGYECVDLESYEGSGYESGGKYVQLIKLDDDSSDSTVDYTCDKILWTNVNLPELNAIKYAVLYREDDGLLISLYDLKGPIVVEGDDFELDWKGSSMLNISTEGTVKVEDVFSKDSKNSVTNRRLTDAFNKYGVLLDNDTTPSEQYQALDSMDRISFIKNDFIDGLFNE